MFLGIDLGTSGEPSMSRARNGCTRHRRGSRRREMRLLSVVTMGGCDQQASQIPDIQRRLRRLGAFRLKQHAFSWARLITWLLVRGSWVASGPDSKCSAWLHTEIPYYPCVPHRYPVEDQLPHVPGTMRKSRTTPPSSAASAAWYAALS